MLDEGTRRTHRSALTHQVTPVGAHNLGSTHTFYTSLSGQLPLLGWDKESARAAQTEAGVVLPTLHNHRESCCTPLLGRPYQRREWDQPNLSGENARAMPAKA